MRRLTVTLLYPCPVAWILEKRAQTFIFILGRFSNFFQKVFQNPMGLDPSSLTTSGSR